MTRKRPQPRRWRKGTAVAKHPEFTHRMAEILLEHLHASFTEFDRIAVVEAMALALGSEIAWQEHGTALLHQQYMLPVWHAALAVRQAFADRVPDPAELESAFREAVPGELHPLLFPAAPAPAKRHGHTVHGWVCCDDGPQLPPGMAVAKCMGPPACPWCRVQVDAIHAGA